MADEDRLHPEFADLWNGSLGRIGEGLAAIERAVGQLEAGALEKDARAEAEARAHKLVGTLGAYGLLRCAALARGLEEGLRGAPTEAAPLRAALDELAGRVADVRGD